MSKNYINEQKFSTWSKKDLVEEVEYSYTLIERMLEMYRFGLSHVTNDFTEELDMYIDELELLNRIESIYKNNN
tara:strand:- start:298 stop:519 length:222 start_codon:yes stop_codon:yes gene_type:complete